MKTCMAVMQWQTKSVTAITKVTVTSPVVINVLNRELLATEHETASSFVSLTGNLNNNNGVCK